MKNLDKTTLLLAITGAILLVLMVTLLIVHPAVGSVAAAILLAIAKIIRDIKSSPLGPPGPTPKKKKEKNRKGKGKGKG